MYAVMHRAVHKSAYAEQSVLVLLTLIYEIVFVVLSFFFFPVLKDESKKHNAESTHNKGGLLNTASGTTHVQHDCDSKGPEPALLS